MTQHPIELILLRQLASYLATPMFVVDAAGTSLPAGSRSSRAPAAYIRSGTSVLGFPSRR